MSGSKTLNYWLSKWNRLQLFGHGTKPVFVKVQGSPVVYAVDSIDVSDERVVIYIK